MRHVKLGTYTINLIRYMRREGVTFTKIGETLNLKTTKVTDEFKRHKELTDEEVNNIGNTPNDMQIKAYVDAHPIDIKLLRQIRKRKYGAYTIIQVILHRDKGMSYLDIVKKLKMPLKTGSPLMDMYNDYVDKTTEEIDNLLGETPFDQQLRKRFNDTNTPLPNYEPADEINTVTKFESTRKPKTYATRTPEIDKKVIKKYKRGKSTATICTEFNLPYIDVMDIVEGIHIDYE